MLLLLCLSSRTDSDKTMYVFQKYMECTQELDEVSKKLRCVCPRWSTRNEEDHCTTSGNELYNRSSLNVSEWFGLQPFSAVRGVLYVVWSICGVPSLSRPRPWPHHLFFINSFDRDGLLKLEGTESEG